jgi:hypothetical protein
VTDQFWGTADSWEFAFTQSGHEATLVLTNIPEIEFSWRQEFPERIEKPFGAAVIAREVPDLVIVEGLEFYGRAELAAFRNAIPPSTLLAGISGAMLHDEQLLNFLDIFLSCRPDYVLSLRQRGINAVHLPQAFDPRVLQHTAKIEKTVPFGFIGSVLPGEKLHARRRKVLTAVARKLDFPIDSPNSKGLTGSVIDWTLRNGAFAASRLTSERLLNSMESTYVGRLLAKAKKWETRPTMEYLPALTPRMQPPVFGLDMYRRLAEMHSTLNAQPGISNNHATNIRLFEATGVGACLVTDRTDDLDQYFREDEVVSYTSDEEAVEKILWLCNNLAEAAAIGDRGQQRTLRDHSYAQRQHIIFDAVNEARRTR